MAPHCTGAQHTLAAMKLNGPTHMPAISNKVSLEILVFVIRVCVVA
jgi:hypothetical protein